MSGDVLRVMQISPSVTGGGAERAAVALHVGLAGRGHRSWMAVGTRDVDAEAVSEIPNEPSKLSRRLRAAAEQMEPLVRRIPPARHLRRLLSFASSPSRYLDLYRGREHFGYPGTSKIPKLAPQRPDVLHLHNLHGGYFDLRQLGRLSRRFPVAMTLHDEWTYTGHCAYTMGSERWRSGCDSCPDLDVYPAIRRNATRANHRAKRAIYARSAVYITAPSRWLLERAQQSILRAGAAGWRHIPNGVDLTVFSPTDRRSARRELGLSSDASVLLFSANMARTNPFKDFAAVRRAANEAAARASRQVRLLVLGDEGPPEVDDHLRIDFVPFQKDAKQLARYYAAADLYLHAARADTFPTTVLEALACGTPVVASAVGGTPEQVRSLTGIPGAWDGPAAEAKVATGVLVPQGDATAMAAASAELLVDDSLRLTLGANAAADAAARFDFELQLDSTIEWYCEIIADHSSRATAGG